MRRTIQALLSAVIVTMALLIAPAAAQASASSCDSKFGSWIYTCVNVRGTGLHVDSIAAQIKVGENKCIYGHSQVMIGGKHYADSPIDGGEWCSDGWENRTYTTKTWFPDANYAKGTKVCAKFWQAKTPNVGPWTEVGNACITVG